MWVALSKVLQPPAGQGAKAAAFAARALQGLLANADLRRAALAHEQQRTALLGALLAAASSAALVRPASSSGPASEPASSLEPAGERPHALRWSITSSGNACKLKGDYVLCAGATEASV